MISTRKTLMFAILLFMAVVSISAQSTERRDTKTITVCRIEFTSRGRSANFHFNYMYLAETDDRGAFKEFRSLKKDFPKFVNEEKMVKCARTWKLKPAQKYIVVFSVGTSGENSISISEVGGEGIKLILDQLDFPLLPDEKPL